MGPWHHGVHCINIHLISPGGNLKKKGYKTAPVSPPTKFEIKNMKSNSSIYFFGYIFLAASSTVFAGGKLTGGLAKTTTEDAILQPFLTLVDGDVNRIIFPASGNTAKVLEVSGSVSGNGKRIFKDWKRLVISSLDGDGEKVFKNIDVLEVKDWKSGGSSRLEYVKKFNIGSFSGKGNILIDENTVSPTIGSNTTTKGAAGGVLTRFQNGKIDETSIKVVVGFEDRIFSPGSGNTGKVLTVTEKATGRKQITFQDWTDLSITSMEGEGKRIFKNIGNLKVTNWNNTGDCQLLGVKATQITNFVGSGNIKFDGNSQVPVVGNQSGTGTINQK